LFEALGTVRLTVSLSASLRMDGMIDESPGGIHGYYCA
jgi:hypothetical protein